MIQISCSDVKKYYGSELVLHDVSFEVQEGERVAIVGPNGCGKSTILKILCKIESSEEGSVAVRKGAVLGYLEQTPEYEPNYLVQDVLNLAFREVFECKEQLQILEEKLSMPNEDMDETLKRYSSCLERYEHLGGYELEERFSRVYQGLQIDEAMLRRPFAMLSGGEKTLINLAKVLLINPDILILDEPTNHLDVSMMDWLESYLQSYKGSVLYVSHDRYFLGKVTTKVIDLEGGTAVTYSYPYTRFVEEKQRRREELEAQYKEQQKQIHKMEQAIKRMRIWAAEKESDKLCSRAKAMQSRLDRMEKIEKPKNISYQAQMDIMETDRSGKDVLQVLHLTKAFDEKQLLLDANLNVYYKEHVAMIGNNGCGKTTFIKMLFGEEKPDNGIVKVGSSLKMAYLPQNVSFPHEDWTVMATFRENHDMSEGKARELLAKYLFKKDTVFKKVGNLSGGERSRLKFAMLIQSEINFLVLDEPTNHLDIPSRERLEEALLEFQGTILMISHDRFFINRLASRVVEIENHEFISFAGDYDDFLREKAKWTEHKRSEQANVSGNGNVKKLSFESKDKVQEKIQSSSKVKDTVKDSSAKQKMSSFTLAHKLEEAENQIQSLEERKAQIMEEMNQQAENYLRLTELEKEQNQIDAELEEAMDCWLELSNA